MNSHSKRTLTHDAPDTAGPNRRGFLQGTGGLLIAFSLLRPQDALAAAEKIGAETAPPNRELLSAWLAVHPDNTATLYTGKVETGNGTQTALAQIAAEELDFPIDGLAVVMGNTAQTVDQGPTYGSLSVRYAGPQIRHAAAAGRQAMLDLAAKHFGVPASELSAAKGEITLISDPVTKITYGKLVDGKTLTMHLDVSGKTFHMIVAPDAKLKDPKTYAVVGKSVPRKDIPAKIFAEFDYIQDVKVEGMLHGRVVRPYGLGAQLVKVDESGLKDIPGFVQIVRKGNFLGVVAKTEWAAIQAADKLGSRLDPSGPTAGGATWSDWNGLPRQDKIWDTIRVTDAKTIPVSTSGSVDTALAAAGNVVKATYQTPFQMHASIGPSCAIADVKPDSAIFWAGTQMPHQSHRDMAKMLGLDPARVEVRWYEAAGAYGRNGLEHVMADAALMSQAVGKPVRVQWMRWDENGWEPKGPAIVQDLTGAIDKDGNITAWRHHMWIPTTSDTNLIAPDLAGLPPIGQTGQGRGAITYAYTFPNADVVAKGEARVALLTAWLRSPAQFETTFAMESFLDELASAGGQDPLAIRLKYLKDPRAIAVLKAAAKAYGWDPRPSPQKSDPGAKLAKGRGLAWVNRDDTRVATIADVTVDRESGAIRVTRVVVAHDCGLVVNLDGVRNQIEGNVIQSLSRTLHEEVTFDTAHVTSRDWIGYPILTFDEIPDKIDIVLINNTQSTSPTARESRRPARPRLSSATRCLMRLAFGCAKPRSVLTE